MELFRSNRYDAGLLDSELMVISASFQVVVGDSPKPRTKPREASLPSQESKTWKGARVGRASKRALLDFLVVGFHSAQNNFHLHFREALDFEPER